MAAAGSRANPKGQAGVGRQPAIPRGCRSARRREPRWQPKTGKVSSPGCGVVGLVWQDEELM